MAQLTCQNLCAGYDGRPVLQDLSFELLAGDYLCIVGENGSGKTNLLEAVHYCALGRSHRTGLDREVVRKGAMMAASGVTLRKKSGKTENLQLVLSLL